MYVQGAGEQAVLRYHPQERPVIAEPIKETHLLRHAQIARVLLECVARRNDLALGGLEGLIDHTHAIVSTHRHEIGAHTLVGFLECFDKFFVGSF